jgi:hypothetical protein
MLKNILIKTKNQIVTIDLKNKAVIDENTTKSIMTMKKPSTTKLKDRKVVLSNNNIIVKEKEANDHILVKRSILKKFNKTQIHRNITQKDIIDTNDMLCFIINTYLFIRFNKSNK